MNISPVLGRTCKIETIKIGMVGASKTTLTHVCASLKLLVKEATKVIREAPTSAKGTSSKNASKTTTGPKFGVMPSSCRGMNLSTK